MENLAIEVCCDPTCANHNKQQIIEMTAEQIQTQEAMRAEAEARQAALEAEKARVANLKAEARAALIAGKPLTPEQAEVVTL